MSYLAQSSTSYYSFSLYIADLNPTSQYTEVYITCNGQTSPNLSRPSGNTTSLFWNVTGLTPGTQYFVTYTLRTSAGSTGSGNGFAETLSLPTPPPNSPTNFRVYARYSGAIGFAWNSVSNADYYSLEVTHAATGSIVFIDYGITDTSQLVTGLQNGVSYNAFLTAINSGGTSPGVILTNVRALEPPTNPTNFRVYDKSNGSISLAWNTVSGANGYSLEIYNATTGNLVWSRYNNSSANAIVTGLTNGVLYNAKVYAVGDGGSSSGTWLYNIESGYDRPSNWSWQISKVKGSSYSIMNNQITNLVSLDEIVAFQTRINEFRLYKELGAYSFVTKSRGQVLTSTMYNQLRNAISEMNPSTPPVSSNNLIDLLNGLRNSLNSVA